MGFKNFRIVVLFRLLFVAVVITATMYLVLQTQNYALAIITGFLAIWLIYDLFNYIDHTNDKLQKFFDSIRYADFTSTYSSDSKRGKSFKDLNKSLAEVINAFQKIRIRNEENLHYLNTIVQHVGIGLVAYDHTGKIDLINNAAKRLLKMANVRNISQIGKIDINLEEILLQLKTGESVQLLIGSEEDKKNVVLSATEFKQRGRNYTLVSIQDIQKELDTKEIESWQTITKILRHEIMNSVTPIASLSSFAIDLLENEWKDQATVSDLSVETIQDIGESLRTIEKRCASLIKFVEGYRNFSTIPTPNFTTFNLAELLNRVLQLLQADKIKRKVDLVPHYPANGLILRADQDLVEMVVINLVKNAFEALQESAEPKIEIRAFANSQNHIIIQIEDNGPGIIPEALDKVFIPFYTTKKGGSGIGLSWSRQIMHLHKGSLTVQSKPNARTVFTLKF